MQVTVATIVKTPPPQRRRTPPTKLLAPFTSILPWIEVSSSAPTLYLAPTARGDEKVEIISLESNLPWPLLSSSTASTSAYSSPALASELPRHSLLPEPCVGVLAELSTGGKIGSEEDLCTVKATTPVQWVCDSDCGNWALSIFLGRPRSLNPGGGPAGSSPVKRPNPLPHGPVQHVLVQQLPPAQSPSAHH
ncbi:hypothetical protein Salat_1178700 [Sesamum alatum]|uniref:Uncharacterized protein n=1 Tax=Sesamum alatum TaxID=300844 RepID=A0AAE1YFT9_9LAMI|nr:hypothetical protein Salat_1178700 [Sesamum alatum]